MPVIDLVICLLVGASLMGAGILIGQHQGWQEAREILWDVAVAMHEQQRSSRAMLTIIEGRGLSEREYARLHALQPRQRPWQARPDTSPRERVPATPAPMPAVTPTAPEPVAASAATPEPVAEQAGE